MNQIELLLRLSENAQDKGDEIAHRYQQERQAHVKELTELFRIIEVARQNVEAELRRFGAVAVDKPAETAQPQLPKSPRSEVPKAVPIPGFLKGGNSATGKGVESGDDQSQHQRAASPR